MKRVRVQPRTARVRLVEPAAPTKAAPSRRSKANRKRLTEDNVRALPSRRKQYMVWDSGTDAVRGLGVLVSPAGAKSYRSTFYYPGSSKPHSRHLGRVGEMSLEEARRLCRADRKNALRGFDPRAGDPTRSDTYAAAVEEYIKRDQIGRSGNASATAKEARRVLLKVSQPTSRGVNEQKPHAWHTRPVATIRAEEIVRELELVRDGDREVGLKPRPYLANSLYGRLCTFFAWCAGPGVGKVKTSPMLGIKKPWNGAQPRERAWFSGAAADDAIRRLWRAADQIGEVEGKYLKLLLLTGKRKTALAEMRWREIDESWFWTPPAGPANKRQHGIPLPAIAQRILHPRSQTEYVFPGEDQGRIYVNGSWLQTKIIKASGISDYLHHGARHIVETKFAELKVPPHLRDLILDHVPSRGSGAGYDHHHYREEMLSVLEMWAAYIVRLVQPEGAALLR